MWIIQEFHSNLFDINGISDYIRIKSVLDSLKIDYTTVYYNSDKELKILTKDFYDYKNSESVLSTITSSPYILHGSVSLDRQFKNDEQNILGRKSLTVDFSNITEVINKKDILNYPIAIAPLDYLYPIADEFFMRPVDDNKVISGGIFTEGQLFAMKKSAKSNEDVELLNSRFILSEIYSIDAEYRFFIVNKEIITYSSYMINNKFNITENVPNSAIDYVKKLLLLYNMGMNYVIDIAGVDGEYKVLEFNGIPASGLYNCDEFKIVKALNQLI